MYNNKVSNTTTNNYSNIDGAKGDDLNKDKEKHAKLKDGSKMKDGSFINVNGSPSKANPKLYPGYSSLNCNSGPHPRSMIHGIPNNVSSNSNIISPLINQIKSDNMHKEKKEEVWWEHYTDGMMFICTKETYEECRELSLLGLPGSHLRLVKTLKSHHSALFLFNVSDRYCHGVFEAVSPGQKNIVPTAWARNQEYNRSRFPAQVQFKIAYEFDPLPESAFRHLFSDANRICKLDSQQVKDLITIFHEKSKNKITAMSNKMSIDSNMIPINSSLTKANIYKNPSSVPSFRPNIPSQNMWKLGQEEMMAKVNKDHTVDHITSCWPLANSLSPTDPEIWPLPAPKPAQLAQLHPHFAQYPSQYLPQYPSQFAPQIPSQLTPLPSQFVSPLASQFPSQFPSQIPSQIPSQSYAPLTLQTLPLHSSQPPQHTSRLSLASTTLQKPLMAKTQNMTIGMVEEFEQMNNCQLNSRFVGSNIGNGDAVKEHNDMLNQQVCVDRQLNGKDQIGVQHTNSEQFSVHRHQQMDNLNLERDNSSQAANCFPPPPGLSHSKLQPESVANYKSIHNDLGVRYSFDHLNLDTSSMSESLTRGPKNLTDHYHKKDPIVILPNTASFPQSESSTHNSNPMPQSDQSHQHQSVRNHHKAKSSATYWNNDTGWHSNNWDGFDFDVKTLWNNAQMGGSSADWSSITSKGGSSHPGTEQARMGYHDNHETWKQDISTTDSSTSFSPQQQHTADNDSYRRNDNSRIRTPSANKEQADNIRVKSAAPLVVKNTAISLSQHLPNLDTTPPRKSLAHADRLSPFPSSQPSTPNKIIARGSVTTEYNNDRTDSRKNDSENVWPIGTQSTAAPSTPIHSTVTNGLNGSSSVPLDPNRKICYKSYGTNFLNASIWSEKGSLGLWANSPSNKNKRSSGSPTASEAEFPSSPKRGNVICDTTHPPSPVSNWA